MLSIREANNVSIRVQGCEMNAAVQNICNMFSLNKNNIEKISRLESSMVLTFSSTRKRLDRESCNVHLMNFLCWILIGTIEIVETSNSTSSKVSCRAQKWLLLLWQSNLNERWSFCRNWVIRS